MTIILLILLLYILPGFIVWLYFHLVYSKGGRYEGLTPSQSDAALVFTPFINLIASVVLWTTNYPIETENSNKRINKFFKIK